VNSRNLSPKEAIVSRQICDLTRTGAERTNQTKENWKLIFVLRHGWRWSSRPTVSSHPLVFHYSVCGYVIVACRSSVGRVATKFSASNPMQFFLFSWSNTMKRCTNGVSPFYLALHPPCVCRSSVPVRLLFKHFKQLFLL
jgi:hypothetical protein